VTQNYPPARHMLRDLQFSFEHDDNDTSRAWMPIVAEVCDATGSVRAGVLATLVDVIGGGLASSVAHPNWIATADLTVHVVGRVEAGATVEARGRVLRAGRTTVVLEVDLADDAEREFGVATMSFSVLPRRDSNPDVSESMRRERTTMATTSSRLTEPIHDALGAQIVDGAIEVPVTDWAKNSMDAMQGGLVALLADLAGERALASAVNDLHIVYLGFGRVGPIRAQAQRLGSRAARIEIFDTGAGNRRMAIASVA
jgi:uncharacterized protein (TIGR00369 family)